MTKHWIDTLQAGDIVRFKNGAFRTVVEVGYRANGRLLAAVFPILRCSWTRRPHTTIHRGDLLNVAERKEPGRIAIRRYPAARTILADLTTRGPDRVGSCCDVIGSFV